MGVGERIGRDRDDLRLGNAKNLSVPGRRVFDIADDNANLDNGVILQMIHSSLRQ